jgi:predicted transposase YdaD
MATDTRQQPYDNLLKRLLEHQPLAIIPFLLPEGDITIVEELNIEVLLPPRRTDRVYKALYNRELHILHLEVETSANHNMDKRLLVYHALLLEKYNLPIISIIIYPFKTVPVTSPLKESDADGEILSFRYRTLSLWHMDARAYVERQATPIYGLLPVMEGTNSDLLLKAIDEMVQYYGDDEEHLRDELLCFKVLLERAQRLTEGEMLPVLRRIHMLDPLLEQDPWIQGLKAQERIAGELAAYRSVLVNIVQMRFPLLAEIAQTRADQSSKPEALNILIAQISVAPDEKTAREVLEAATAS